MTTARYIPLHAALAATALLGGLSAQRQLDAFAGLQHDGRTGQAIAPAGDLNGDGYDDLIVGHPLNDYPNILDRGLVIVYSGADGRWLVNTIGSRPGMHLGTSVCRVGDVDLDGVADFAAGGPDDGGDSGYARVFSGSTGNVIWERTGEPQSQFGTAVCGIGDVDHDGRPDVAISAPRNSTSTPYGFVGIYSGRNGAELYRLRGGSQQDFGAALASGDLDGDRRPDLVVGSPGFDFLSVNSGMVFAYRMHASTTSDLWMFYTEFYSLEYGGLSLGTVADLDGDHCAEVLVGGKRGRALVLSGRTGAVLRRHHGINSDAYGHALAGLGDVDGDAVPDYAIGAPEALSGTGRVEVLSGRDGNTIVRFAGEPGSRFGFALAGLGDLDGDTLAEVAVGAPLYARPDGRRVGRATVHAIDIPGTAQRYGSGCPATRPLALDGGGSLRPGGSLRLDVTNGRPFEIVSVFLGLSRTTWNGVPLPLALGPIAQPGCTIQASVDVILPTVSANLSGDASVTLPVPKEPALFGARFYVQALQGLAGLGLSASNGVAVRLGNQ